MGKDYSDKAEEAVLPKFGETSDKVKALQTALIERGFTEVGKADGIYGEATRKAISSLQNKADLEVSGVVDQDTFISLYRQPVKAKAASAPKSNLLDFIGKGEGGYDSANRGTVSGNVVGSEMVASRGGKKVSELTVGEIKKYQSITDPNNKDRLFTVGKYQATPDTFNQAVKGLGLSDDTVFTPEVQEKVGLYLVSEKRPKVGKFLRGEGGISTDTAMLELAKEFASIPVPTAIAKGTYGKWPKTDLVAGDSFYKNPKASKGNKAQHTVEETRAILEKARTSTPINKYKIPDSTLRDLSRRMNLPADTVFNKETQDKMFLFLARENVAKGKTLADKRKNLRSIWEGFKYVDNSTLDRVIQEIGN